MKIPLVTKICEPKNTVPVCDMISSSYIYVDFDIPHITGFGSVPGTSSGGAEASRGIPEIPENGAS